MGWKLTSDAGTVGAEQRAVDVALAAACGRGEPVAQRELLARLFDRVRRMTTYLAGPTGEAEDLAQVALVQILASAEGYRGDCPLEFWADRIAAWTAMKHLHKAKRRRSLAEAVWDPGLAPVTADAETATRELRIGLAAKLQEISEERRVAVVLHHVEGYGVDEIAALTGATRNTVRDRLRKGRAILRKKVLADPVLRVFAKALEP